MACATTANSCCSHDGWHRNCLVTAEDGVAGLINFRVSAYHPGSGVEMRLAKPVCTRSSIFSKTPAMSIRSRASLGWRRVGSFCKSLATDQVRSAMRSRSIMISGKPAVGGFGFRDLGDGAGDLLVYCAFQRSSSSRSLLRRALPSWKNLNVVAEVGGSVFGDQAGLQG